MYASWIETGLMRGGLFIAAIIILIVTRSRWSNDLYIPKSLGRWFLASLWLVYPLAFWFAGIAIENGGSSHKNVGITVS